MVWTSRSWNPTKGTFRSIANHGLTTHIYKRSNPKTQNAGHEERSPRSQHRCEVLKKKIHMLYRVSFTPQNGPRTATRSINFWKTNRTPSLSKPVRRRKPTRVSNRLHTISALIQMLVMRCQFTPDSRFCPFAPCKRSANSLLVGSSTVRQK